MGKLGVTDKWGNSVGKLGVTDGGNSVSLMRENSVSLMGFAYMEVRR